MLSCPGSKRIATPDTFIAKYTETNFIHKKSSLPAGSGSPKGLISMMEGVSQSYGRSTTIPGFGAPGGTPWWGMRTWQMAVWIQDDMKLTSKLTVNLGLRYEYH